VKGFPNKVGEVRLAARKLVGRLELQKLSDELWLVPADLQAKLIIFGYPPTPLSKAGYRVVNVNLLKQPAEVVVRGGCLANKQCSNHAYSVPFFGQVVGKRDRTTEELNGGENVALVPASDQFSCVGYVRAELCRGGAVELPSDHEDAAILVSFQVFSMQSAEQ